MHTRASLGVVIYLLGAAAVPQSSAQKAPVDDCNADGVTDEFNILRCVGSPSCRDCNGNDFPDECDVDPLSDAQTSFDCNANGIPDECDLRRRVVGANPAFFHELNTLTGAATPVSGVRPGGFRDVQGLALDPNSNTLYGVDSDTDLLIAIDAATGSGSPVGPVGFSNVGSLAFDSNRNVLYGTTNVAQTLIEIDPLTGAGTTIGQTGFQNVWGLAFDAVSDTLFGMDSSVVRSQLITIDLVSGKGTVVGELFFGANILGLAFDPDAGVLFGVNLSGNSLVTIDPASASTTRIAGGLFDTVIGLTFDPNTDRLLGSAHGTPDYLISIDPSTGSRQTIGPLGSPTAPGFLGFDSVHGLAFDRNRNALYAVHSAGYGVTPSLIRIDTITGSETFVGKVDLKVQGSIFNVMGLAFDPNSDTLFGVYDAPTQLITIDPSTGDATTVGSMGTIWFTGLAFDENTDTLFAVDGNARLFTIDPVTVGRTLIGGIGFGTRGIAFDADSDTLFGTGFDPTGNWMLITIDPSTGAGSVVGPTHHIDINGLAVLPPFAMDCNSNATPDACEECNNGDIDDDNDVDLIDFGEFVLCLSGPDADRNPGLRDCAGNCLSTFDCDADRDVDLKDFGQFQNSLFEP